MKTITLDALKTIALAMASLPVDRVEVHLGSFAVEATNQLAAIPGARHTVRVYDGTATREPPYTIFEAAITVDGIRFSAAWNRPATADEIARAIPVWEKSKQEAYSRAASFAG